MGRPRLCCAGFYFWAKEGKGFHAEYTEYAEKRSRFLASLGMTILCRRRGEPSRGAAVLRPYKEKQDKNSAEKGEDEEIALAGDDDGEGAAIRGDGEIAEA
jgi:hypothetical protein